MQKVVVKLFLFNLSIHIDKLREVVQFLSLEIPKISFAPVEI